MKLVAIAAVQHEIWAHWMRYLFSQCTFNTYGEAVIPADKVERWQRQLNTAYVDLTPAEQASDINQATKVLNACKED